MELTYECSGCQVVNHLADVDRSAEARCRHCGLVRQLHSASIEAGGLLACPCCATGDLYIQKDFPQGLGLFIVILGFAVSTVFWYLERPIPAYLVLLASALLDMLLYYRVPDVTICYRCLSQVRGPGSNPGRRFQPFDLAIGERYRQERIRVQELRSRHQTTTAGATAPSPSPSNPSSSG